MPRTLVGMGLRAVLSTQLGIPPENIRVISHFVGGAFGAKGSTWPHTTLATLAARQVGLPVKLVVTRHQMFSSTGHRPEMLQRISLGANRDGKLTALVHDLTSHTSPFDEYVEAAEIATRMLYACPNVKTMHRIARLNVNTPSVMRGPSEASGTFALESAIDELAYAVNLDPIELRLRNYA